MSAGLGALILVGALTTGCPSIGGGVLSIVPFAQITAVQLFDEPEFTIAFSVTGAVSDPTLVAKINWVFGDGGGFVEGPPGRTTITHQYANTGTYQVTAFVFAANGNFVDQINGSVTVLPGDGSGSVQPEPTTPEKPAAASGFSPANNATDVSVDVDLRWSAGARAVSHDVYLGTDQTTVTSAGRTDTSTFRGNQRTTTFDPGTLNQNTTYYWRIDEVNSGGTTKGSVNSFKTARAPAQARNPVPVTGSTSARVDQILRWTAGTRALSHDVFIGKNMAEVDAATREDEDVFKGNRTGTTFDPEDEDADTPGLLLPDTTYFWRIDEVGAGGTTKGQIWSFRTQPAPPAITNPEPADGASEISISTLLSWSGVSTIESYDVYFGTAHVDVESATSSSPEFRGNQTTRLFTPGELLPDRLYFWRIDTLGPGGTSRGTVLSFRTATLPPAAAAPFLPPHLATNVLVDTNLEWEVGVGGTTNSFDVYLSTDETAIINGSASAFQVNLPVTQRLFNPPNNLVANTNYFWRIDARGPGGRTIGAVRTFRTGILANQAEGPTPAIGATAVSLDVILSWTPGMNATGHDVYFGTNQTSVTNASKMDAEFRGSLPLATTTFDPPGTLLPNTDYFWRIDETAAGGETKGAIWRFTTGPAKAINPNPLDGATDGSTALNLSWTAGGGASSHDVYLGTSSAQVLTATRLTPGIYRGNQTTTTFTPNPALDAGTTYFWRIDEVATVNGVVAITKGDVWQFSTGLGKATAPNPANLATGVALDAFLEWTAGAGAMNHDVYLGTNLIDVTNATATSVPAGVIRERQSFTTFDPPGSLNPNTTYFWRVDTVGAIGDLQSVKKGDIWRFTTVALPTQATTPAPADGATNVALPVTLTWEAAAATSFDVYLGTSLAAVQTATPATAGIFRGNQATKTHDPTGIAAGTTYFWRIDARNELGTTPGAVWSFTTAGTLPSQAGSPSPADGATDVATPVTLSWSAVGASSYDVYVGSSLASVQSATPATAGIFRGNQTTTTHVPSGITLSSTFFWRIDARNTAGTTTGAVWSFTTRPPPPVQASSPTPANGAVDVPLAVTLSWQGPGATSYDVYFGTSQAAVLAATTASPEFRGNQATRDFTPSGLATSTQYFWRIDSKNAAGTTAGQVWSFTTTASAASPPQQASSPSPPHGSVFVPMPVTLTWIGTGATSFDVYFGTSEAAVQAATPASPEFRGNQTTTSFSPTGLTAVTNYFWRIDAKNDVGTTTGAVWRFSTGF